MPTDPAATIAKLQADNAALAHTANNAIRTASELQTYVQGLRGRLVPLAASTPWVKMELGLLDGALAYATTPAR